MPLLSVIIPAYNEGRTIGQILEKVNSIDIDKEVIVVDDGSSDDTAKILAQMRPDSLKIIHHGTNRGKGAAFLTGLANASGELVIVQDADLEYDPRDYAKLINQIQGQDVDIVLGARFMKGYKGLLIPMLGNRLLTSFINLLFATRANDFLTCYKLLRRETLNKLGLNSQGFDIDMEIVTKILKRKMRIKEVPVVYRPRNYWEGKKIRWLDGLRAILCIIRYRLQD